MGKTYDRITPDVREFIARQQMFFVATAPLGANGHVNLSPKGLDTFRVLDEQTVAYLDLTGSGNETSAHLEENGRITLMFCAFDGPPMIVRLYGRGQTILPDTPDWSQHRAAFGEYPGVRQIILARIDRAMTSCGFAVPQYEYVDQRDQLVQYAAKSGPDNLAEYRREKNTRSIDGMVTTLGKLMQ